MNGKKIGDLTVNDGGGLLDSEGLCDSLMNDLNNFLKQTISGQYIIACSVVTQMAQKLINLKKGIENDLKSRNDIIESSKEQIAILEQRLEEERKKNKSDG